MRRLLLRHDVNDNVADYVPPIDHLVSGDDVIEAEPGSDHMVHRPCSPQAVQPVDRRAAVLQRQAIDTDECRLALVFSRGAGRKRIVSADTRSLGNQGAMRCEGAITE